MRRRKSLQSFAPEVRRGGVTATVINGYTIRCQHDGCTWEYNHRSAARRTDSFTDHVRAHDRRVDHDD